jgi:hypothetical protein
VIRRYCSLWDERSTLFYRRRSVAIRTATWLKPPDYGSRKRWSALRQFVERFATRAIEDPCTEATHFGGEMDTHRVPPSWRVVCVFGETYKQYFYAE